jgi:endonuclease/exonuclease/phosphatase family metal-dependent hydrolase
LPPLDNTAPITAADFTVCSYNAHGLGRGSEQFWEPAAYDQQLAKHAHTIAESLQGCTIIGLQETGRPEDAARLAELLANAFELEYAVVALPGPNTQSNEFPLTNSLLARRDRVQIVSSALPQGCSPIDYKVALIDESCLPGTFPLFNRPPLVVDLTVQGPWGEPFPLTVINNHWKSKGGDETVNVVRRTAQAAHVASLVQARLDRNPATNLLVLGDLNDYRGSVPVETLRASPEPPLHHTYDRLPALDRYSYIYNGGSQVLDHILVTPNLESLLARVDPVHINADYPGADNDQVALRQRSSDHEPILIQIRPAGVGTLGGNLGFPDLKVTLLLSASTADGQSTALDTIVAETVTDALGDFRFWALAPGRYDLRIDAPAHFSQNAQTGILSIIPGYQMLTAQLLLHRDVAEALAFMQLAPTLVAQVITQ